MTILIVIVVSVLALGASYVLQPIITGPILSLVGLTKRISEEKDYSLRAPTSSTDEVGVLSSSFNHMLATIQDREKELYEINEKAEAASHSKSEFLANMSHEIRTPINGILGFAQLLSVMELDEKQRNFVDIILSSGQQLLTIINDILDFSKIEAGKLHIESVPFDLSKVIEEVATMQAANAEKKGLQIVSRFAPGTPIHVIGDPSRVRQILLNYVSNAIKFTESGHVMINVEPEILGNTETMIRFSVIDTGIGISKEAQAKIFDKFIQADASTTKKYGGTGLGLAISQQLSQLMGGDVGLSSVEGEGSTFWTKIPFRLDQDQVQASEAPTVDMSGLRLLIVDDHEVNRRILLELAETWNVRASAAESGEEALHLMKKAQSEKDPFHIAILDFQLPNMDGEDLSNLIKTDKELAHTSLILLTSMGMRGDAGKFQEIGFEAYLVKPARATVLLDTVSTVWAKRLDGQKPDQIITRHTFSDEDDERRGTEEGSEEQRRVDREIIDTVEQEDKPNQAAPNEPQPKPEPPVAPQPDVTAPAPPPVPPQQPPAQPQPQPGAPLGPSLEERMQAIVSDEPPAATPPQQPQPQPAPPQPPLQPPAAAPAAPPATNTPAPAPSAAPPAQSPVAPPVAEEPPAPPVPAQPPVAPPAAPQQQQPPAAPPSPPAPPPPPPPPQEHAPAIAPEPATPPPPPPAPTPPVAMEPPAPPPAPAAPPEVAAPAGEPGQLTGNERI
ncbi:MAG: ATP-binding protein, partial [Rickettsiales bacterium]